MAETLAGKLIVAISSRALFNLDESHAIYEQHGVDAYSKYQIDHEKDILEPGVAFFLVKKLLQINELAKQPIVEILLLSRNSADTGLRIFNSIQHYGLNIHRAAFSSGQSPFSYVSAFGSHLFLSADPADVTEALEAGFAAATIVSSPKMQQQHEELRIAFDGDAVIFSDEAERIFQEQGLAAFAANEAAKAEQPLSGGPFKAFLAALHKIQDKFPADACPIRTALVTARSAPSHERVVKTLRAWKIRIDEAIFLGGLPKGDILKAFKADFFFDDQHGHCQSAADQAIATAHVPHGIVNNI